MGTAATEEIDFSRTVANHPFMVKLFCMALLAGCLCYGSARSGVRMADAALVMSLFGTSLDDWADDNPFSGRAEMEREPVMESAWLYWSSAPDRAARIWRELAEKD